MNMMRMVTATSLALAMAVCAYAAPASGGRNDSPAVDDSNWRGGPTEDWFVNWDKALAESKKSGKALFLLNTGSDWCGWCKKLRAEVLDKPEFAEFARKNLVLVYLDSPNRNPLGKEQKRHNRQIVKALPFGGGVPHVLVMNAKGEKLGAIGGGGLGLDEYLEKLRGIVSANGERVSGNEARLLFKEGYAALAAEIAARRAALPPVTKEDFKAKLTGVAVVEQSQRYGKKEGIEFVAPETKLEVPYGKTALFRVEYDFPEGYGARVWTRDGKCDDGKSHSWYFGSNPSGVYNGKGTAYGFLSLLDRGKTCRVKELLLNTNTDPELDEYPHGWTIATVPVDVEFIERAAGADAEQQDGTADAPAVSKSVPKGWTEDFEAAKEQAAKEGKLILIDFSGSDWCGWCKKMDEEVFAKDRFVREASKKFVLMMVDSPNDKSILSVLARKQNSGLKETYSVRGFPTVVIVDPEGKEVKRHSGYRSGGPNGYLKYLRELARGVEWPKNAKEQVGAEKSGRQASTAVYRFEGGSDTFFFSWGVPMGGLLQKAQNIDPDAATRLVEEKISANKKAIVKIAAEMNKMLTAKTTSDAKRALGKFESAVKVYHDGYVSGYGKWPLKDWELAGEKDSTARASVSALEDIVSKAESDAAKQVYAKRLAELKAHLENLKKRYEEMRDKALRRKF